MALKLITAPTSEPVTIEQAKLWLRLDSNAEIDTVQQLITAARQALDGADGYLGRCLVEQIWEMTIDRFPVCDGIPIPLPPLIEIVSIKYLDGAGDEQTVDTETYRAVADDWSGTVHLATSASWPTVLDQPDSITIRFRAGYTAGVPEGLKIELLRLVGSWFDNREQAGQIPDGWSSRYRLVAVA